MQKSLFLKATYLVRVSVQPAMLAGSLTLYTIPTYVHSILNRFDCCSFFCLLSFFLATFCAPIRNKINRSKKLNYKKKLYKKRRAQCSPGVQSSSTARRRELSNSIAQRCTEALQRTPPMYYNKLLVFASKICNL